LNYPNFLKLVLSLKFAVLRAVLVLGGVFVHGRKKRPPVHTSGLLNKVPNLRPYARGVQG